MKYLILAFGFLAVVSVSAQTDSVTNDILTTKTFRWGIYETFEELKTNSPSITESFYVVGDTGLWKSISIRFDDTGKKIRNVYGFSNGRNIYVNAGIYQDGANYYLPVQIVGPILYFEDAVGKNQVATHAYPGAGFGVKNSVYSAMKNPGWIIYLNDDGHAYFLDKKTIASILETDDKELALKLKSDKRKMNKIVLREYVIEFNQRKAKTSK